MMQHRLESSWTRSSTEKVSHSIICSLVQETTSSKIRDAGSKWHYILPKHVSF